MIKLARLTPCSLCFPVCPWAYNPFILYLWLGWISSFCIFSCFYSMLIFFLCFLIITPGDSKQWQILSSLFLLEKNDYTLPFKTWTSSGIIKKQSQGSPSPAFYCICSLYAHELVTFQDLILFSIQNSLQNHILHQPSRRHRMKRMERTQAFSVWLSTFLALRTVPCAAEGWAGQLLL